MNKKNKKSTLKRVAGGLEVNVNKDFNVGNELKFVDNSRYIQSSDKVDKVDIEYKHTDKNISIGGAISDAFSDAFDWF